MNRVAGPLVIRPVIGREVFNPALPAPVGAGDESAKEGRELVVFQAPVFEIPVARVLIEISVDRPGEIARRVVVEKDRLRDGA
ncbi:hypothetical protein V502_03469 [Pseudogymnoascus sp. VKM F-4520 (FW-2644)]|nr:hypothetical protein V502_03469 [Pseudogymnoascus sp. VKM F-4520 (FW-2644)]